MTIKEEIEEITKLIEKFYEGNTTTKAFLRKTEELTTSFSKDYDNLAKNFSKLLISFLFNCNMVIVKNQNGVSSTIRHYFKGTNPKEVLYCKLEPFFQKVCSIKINQKNDKTYFSVSNLSSIIKILLFWYESSDFEFVFTEREKKGIQDLFTKRKIFVYFNEQYIEKINGLIKNSNLTLEKFINSLSNKKKFKRTTYYKWRREKCFPLEFLDFLLKSDYVLDEKFDRDYFNYIDFIQLGKQMDKDRKNDNYDSESRRIKKDLLMVMKENYDRVFEKFIPGGTHLGSIFKIITPERGYINKLKNSFKKELDRNFNKKILNKYEKYLTLIEKRLTHKQESISIQSLTLKNFKSFTEQTIIFEKFINVVYGLNGSGKTSIIEAIMFALLLLNPFGEDEKEIDNIFITNPWLIQIGKNCCSVTLELKKGERIITIERKLTRNGRQELLLDGEDLFSKIGNEKAKEMFTDIEKIKKAWLEKEKEEIPPYRRYRGGKDVNILEPWPQTSLTILKLREQLKQQIWRRFSELGLNFAKSEIFSSLFMEFKFLWSYSSYSRDDIRVFLEEKFKMNHLIKKMKDLEKKREVILEELSSEAFSLITKLAPISIYDFINKNDLFFIHSSENCYGCELNEAQKEGEIMDIGVEGGYIAKYMGGFEGITCQKCKKFYCRDCIKERSECGEKIIFCESKECHQPLQYELYKRREYLPEDFYILVEDIKTNFKKTQEQLDNELIQYDNYDLLDKYKIVKEYLQLKEELLSKKHHKAEMHTQKIYDKISKIIEKVRGRFNPDYYDYYRNNSILINADDSEKFKKPFLKLLLKDIQIIIKNKTKSRLNTSIEILSDFNRRFQVILKSTMRKEKLLQIGKNCIDFLNKIELMIQSSEKTKNFWSIDDLNQVFRPFELKIIKLINYIFNFLKDLDSNKNYIFSPSNEDVINSMNAFRLKLASILKKEDKKENIFKNLDEIYVELEILLSQLKNQAQLIKIIDLYNGKISRFNQRLYFLNERLNFLKKVRSLLYKCFIKNVNKQLSEKSPHIFQQSNYLCFLDKEGIPRIKVPKTNIMYPMTILSNGEKSKLLLALLGILISYSNKNLFFLIDEPNELLDPENVNIIKDYFSNIFKNKQIILFTFIEKYKDYRPASVYEVKKNSENTSFVNVIKP